ncbi:hypothetical protein LH464_05190 [Neorhizobium sp. T786]|uniref:hypothetical protein n=1 Tax=Pseudorhizobium xiangyangii TaxID=2883104 RepID=UPI001D001082|nr:hypothetical protein [Neorhizobium xiangyangii]MCB5201872.1 hypothetical protein [Neorhizobium xiangyangii]
MTITVWENGVLKEKPAGFIAPIGNAFVGTISNTALTPRQLRLGLVTNGFSLDQVDGVINAIEDPQHRAIAMIEWRDASQFERDHPLIAQVGAALGLTGDQIDGMWEQALPL